MEKFTFTDTEFISSNSFARISDVVFSEVISKNLRVMDLTAITLCKENNLPVQVFNINKYGNLRKLVLGKDIGTIIN